MRMVLAILSAIDEHSRDVPGTRSICCRRTPCRIPRRGSNCAELATRSESSDGKTREYRSRPGGDRGGRPVYVTGLPDSSNAAPSNNAVAWASTVAPRPRWYSWLSGGPRL